MSFAVFLNARGPRLTEAQRDFLKQFLRRRAARVKTEPEHWISGSDDEATPYCYACAKKKVAELLKAEPDADYRVGGGYGSEGDGTPFCEGCGKRLETSFTDYACESEVDHFMAHGFNPKYAHDCLSMSEVIDARGWEPWAGRVWQAHEEWERQKDEEYFGDLHQLCREILAKIRPHRPAR